MKKIIIVGGAINEYSLEASYKRAFEKLGFNVWWFDAVSSVNKFVKFGRFGSYFNQFVPVEPWIKKMSREFVIQAKNYNPDLIIVVCNSRLSLGSLVFLKSVLKCKIILLWPDTVFNIENHVALAAELYDGVASYSKVSLKIFSELGFKNVNWIPLAADESIHQVIGVPFTFESDLCFIGGHRPEREQTLVQIIEKFKTIKIEVFGTDWQKSTNSTLKKYIRNRPLRGGEFAQKMNQSRINLNVIDDTNFPAANMRFFETPITSSLQLSSSCPEFEHIFIDKTHILYFQNQEELYDKIDFILANETMMHKIRVEAHNLVLTEHTYYHRANLIIQNFL